MSPLSPEIGRLFAELEQVWHARHPQPPAEPLEDKAYGRLLDREDRLIRRLAEEPILSPGDRQAKLGLVCLRLRQDLNLTDPRHMTTYLLAESTRDITG